MWVPRRQTVYFLEISWGCFPASLARAHQLCIPGGESLRAHPQDSLPRCTTLYFPERRWGHAVTHQATIVYIFPAVFPRFSVWEPTRELPRESNRHRGIYGFHGNRNLHRHARCGLLRDTPRARTVSHDVRVTVGVPVEIPAVGNRGRPWEL